MNGFDGGIRAHGRRARGSLTNQSLGVRKHSGGERGKGRQISATGGSMAPFQDTKRRLAQVAEQ